MDIQRGLNGIIIMLSSGPSKNLAVWFTKSSYQMTQLQVTVRRGKYLGSRGPQRFGFLFTGITSTGICRLCPFETKTVRGIVFPRIEFIKEGLAPVEGFMKRVISRAIDELD